MKERIEKAGRVAESVLRATGRVASWSLVALAAAILANVVLRYVLNRPLTVLAELQWHLYALGATAGMACAMTGNSHVRVDFLYGRFPAGLRRAVDTFSIVVLLLPLCVFLAVEGYAFMELARGTNEGSPSGGLPHRWIVKSLIPAGAMLLGVAALAKLAVIWCGDDHYRDAPPPPEPSHPDLPG